MLFTLKYLQTTIFTQKTRTEAIGLRVSPRLHRHKIRYKTGNWAFENCIVASDNALRRYIDFISLVRNWKKKEKLNLQNMQHEGKWVRRFPHYQILLWSKGFPQSQPRSRPWQSQLQSWGQSRRISRHCQWWRSHGICPLQSPGLSLKGWNKINIHKTDKTNLES